ncbi:Gfo/Idh/MocA family oxidoreductase [Paenibacillus sp. GP183]|uniref:Gfo/Idh/MocA family protein n=1 Tax=Paenibacillus sp. GP183 TaxID=1882751 RepID=UPI00089D7773|nr:Gfo/Idh/MocA family oxidoreductase [Paenibacillus sp. GP183]SEB97617.1 Predicted dehydrogenase [Paenibacillus sp. GP183]
MIRFGVIGTNWITEQFIQAALESEEFALSAVYSRTEERAKDFAAKYDIPNLYTDLESMAASDQVDAVYIASPNSFHAKQTIVFLNHGKHVLCEKPIASNAAETKAMIAASQMNNVLLMEALKSTLMPNFRAVVDNLHKIGTVRRYFASYCQYSSRYDAFKQGNILNAFNPAYSNGSLMDLGIYCLYPLVTLFGKPNSVQAAGVLLSSGVDGEGSMVMSYKDMDAVIQHSKISNSYLPAEIQGENGTIVIDKINQPGSVRIHYKDGSVEDITVPQVKPSMHYEVKEFIELMKSGRVESTVNSHANSLAAMEVIDETRRQIGLVFAADLK